MKSKISKSLDLTYKQTGIQQALNIKHTAVKAVVPEEFVERVLLKGKHYSGRQFKAINKWAIPARTNFFEIIKKLRQA